MTQLFSRGGAKPSMLHANGTPVKIEINGRDRGDLYELSKDGKWLARRVELPQWLSDKTRELRASRQYLLETLSSTSMDHPKQEQGERHGHILVEAHRYTNQNLACVGVDMPIIDRLSKKPPEKIQFSAFADLYNREWRLEKLRYRSPLEARRDHENSLRLAA